MRKKFGKASLIKGFDVKEGDLWQSFVKKKIVVEISINLKYVLFLFKFSKTTTESLNPIQTLGKNFTILLYIGIPNWWLQKLQPTAPLATNWYHRALFIPNLRVFYLINTFYAVPHRQPVPNSAIQWVW